MPTSTMPHSRRRAWPISTFQLLKLRRESRGDTERRLAKARWALSFGARRAEDGCDGLLTRRRSLTSRGGIRDWSLCSRAATKADTGDCSTALNNNDSYLKNLSMMNVWPLYIIKLYARRDFSQKIYPESRDSRRTTLYLEEFYVIFSD